jgi:polyisoprenoid-binding protein YceI
MVTRRHVRAALDCLALALFAAVLTSSARAADRAPLALDSARISIAGTSNVHEYTAETTTVRLARVQLADGVASSPDLWTKVLEPGAVQAFEIAVPVKTLASGKSGLDKNMHKALKADQHADITFRLLRLEPGANGGLKATGVLRVAGTERELAIDFKTERTGGTLALKGAVPLLMTDYGVKPPTAMLGMLKTDPKVTLTIEAVLSAPLT